MADAGLLRGSIFPGLAMATPAAQDMTTPRSMSSPIDQFDPLPPRRERCMCVRDAAPEPVAQRGRGGARTRFLGGCTSTYPWPTALACRTPPAAPPAFRKATSLRAVRGRGGCSFVFDARSQAVQNGVRLADLQGSGLLARPKPPSLCPVALEDCLSRRTHTSCITRG